METVSDTEEARLKFPKLATNLAVSLLTVSCQSNYKLGNEVASFDHAEHHWELAKFVAIEV